MPGTTSPLFTSRTISVPPTSNGMRLEAEFLAPMRESTDLLARPDLLRRRYHEDGYVLLRGVLDPAMVRQLRADYFAGFPAGYVKPGSDPADGLYSGHRPAGLEDYGVPGHPAHAFVRGEQFDAFVRQPGLHRIAEAILDGPCRLVRRKVLRHFDSASHRASRAHIDSDYPSGAGSDGAVTLWIPLGDCPLETGGLIYLSGSRQADVRRLKGSAPAAVRTSDPRPISSDLNWTAAELGGQWLWTDYRAGDIAVHHPDLVHASLDTTTEAMRLSTDLRFHRDGTPPNDRWNVDWSADDRS